MSLSSKFFAAAAAAATLGFVSAAHAVTVDPSTLAGNASQQLSAIGDAFSNPASTGNDIWENSTLLSSANTGYGGYPGVAPWPGPINSNIGGDAGLYKLANGVQGGPYPGMGSIYFGGGGGAANTLGGTLAASDLTALNGVQTIAFQLELAGVPDSATTYDFFNHELPTLSLNGLTYSASFSEIIDTESSGFFPVPGVGNMPVFKNTYLLVWDLSSAGLNVADPVNDFSISFSPVLHAQLYSLRLDQSADAVDWNGSSIPTDPTSAVPEPASAGLLALGGLALLARRRRD